MPPLIEVIIKRPSRMVPYEHILKGDDWEKLATLPPDTDSWMLHNKSLLQTINYGFREKPTKYGTVSPDDRVTEETAPREIWIQRTDPLNQPTVYLEVWRIPRKKG